MKNYGLADEHTPLTKTLPPDYVVGTYMTNPNRLYRKQVHQFQCCICAVVLSIFGLALAVTILYSVDRDSIDIIPDLPSDNASLQLLLSKSWPIPDNGVPEWQVDSPTPQEIEAAVVAGKTSLAAKDKLEASNLGLPVNSPSYRHQASIKTSAQATNLARSAYIMEEATKAFVLKKTKPKPMKNETTSKTVGRGPALTTDWLPTSECGLGPLPPCPSNEYRSVDGTCNNPYKPTMWGVAMRPYRRQIAPDYADGVSAPRMASDGTSLPSARAVSVTVHRPVYRDDPKFTVMLAVWGQFMDHDITAFALSLGAGGKPISCCKNASEPMHPECFPVHLDQDDPYYQQFGITCMEFVRSAPAATCSMGPREQLNQVSSYLDGSVVYGNTAELARSLRSYQSGQLKMLETADGRSLLPISNNLEDGCNREDENAKGRYCFMTGDTRANENTHLTSLHLLMARQHNMIALQLADMNPEWNDEKLYQEARKIVGAQMQHITYNEFLPVLLGPDMMSQLDLEPQKDGYYNGYDPTVDATISNNFASAAFRFAHTLLPALMKTVAKDWGSEESIEMHKMLFDPFKLYQTGALDKVLQGAINTHLERADSYFNTQLTQHLFQATGEDITPSAPRYGLDLVSLNVQRGRDHGLPAYPVWRQYCGLSRPKTWEDMVGVVDEGSLERMKTLYKSVDDIDMYTGALSEFPIEGGMVGPTVTCLVSDQFKRLKQGDSFWYETDKQPQAFTIAQLNEIRKTSLASVICEASDDVTMVQPEVMKSISLTNTRIPCTEIPRPDLTKWAGVKQEASFEGKKPKSTRIGLSVTSGSIKTTSGDLLWDGSFPIVVPIPVFSIKKAVFGPAASGAFGHGVQWKGTVLESALGMEISGSFSYPIYSHGPIPLGTNYSTKWVNGEFSFNAVVTSNNTDISELSLPGNYESPLYMSEQKFVLKDEKKKFVLGAADDMPAVVGEQRLPIILYGAYSLDRSSFSWTGNATITIPSGPPAVVAPPILTGPKPPTVSGAFSVVSGSMKLESPDGSSKVIWNGDLPIPIPVSSPYKVIIAGGTGEKFPVFGSGAVWSAAISGSKLEGSFSFPQFNRTFSMLYVNWLNGEFSVDVMPLRPNSSLELLLTPGLKYTSKIILRQEPIPGSLLLGDVFTDSEETPGSLEDLVVESQDVLDGIVKAPIILHGTFSPDKTVFYFNGNVMLAVRPTKPKIYKQMQLLQAPEVSYFPWGPGAGYPKFGGIVNSGHITAGFNGASSTTVWSGTLPLAIPMPTFFSPMFDAVSGKSFIFGNGVIWSGTITGSTVKGTYSLPQSIWSMGGMGQQSWAGEFAFEINPLWSATLNSLFVPGAKYYSKISFQGQKFEPGLNSLKGVPGDDPSVAMSAPLILQGTYSLDKTTFYWSGGFIIKFRNKPILTLKLKKSLSMTVAKSPADKPKASIALDITSGSIIAGFTSDEPNQVWSGKLPATIPYGNLMSSAETWRTFPAPNVIWSGDAKNGLFEGTFAVPTYKQNGTAEIVDWWAGNFSFKYTTKWGAMLENYIKPGKKYEFETFFGELQKGTAPKKDKSKNDILKFTQEAQAVIGSAKSGKLVLRGSYWSKAFYCYILPFCSQKKEYYWSGGAVLVFPDPPKNKSIETLKMSASDNVQVTGGSSPQFGGQVVSGSIEGGLASESTNVWWSGKLPIEIPTAIFWTNKTKAVPGLIGGRTIEWSGTLTGNLLKGTFSFPQLVPNFPVPTVQYWSGKFVFIISPLWNTTLDGLIQSEVTYTSGIHFQGIKIADDESIDGKKFILGAEPVKPLKKKAPIILQGTLSPDGSTFIWSGKFIMSVKKYPFPITPLTKKKPTSTTMDIAPSISDNPTPVTHAPVTVKPTKAPKLSVSFTVITGQLSATNGSDPVNLWHGEIPVNINTDMFNPTQEPGAGVSIMWTPSAASPDFSGTFSVTVYSRNGSILTPVQWTGNFSMHYLVKWSGAIEGLVEPGKPYQCNVIFKELAVKKSVQSSPGFLDNSSPNELMLGDSKQFVLGDQKQLGAGPATACSLIVNGKNFQKNENPFFCRLIPFVCSNKPPSNWFSFYGDAMLVIKPLMKMAAAPAIKPNDSPISPSTDDNPAVQVSFARRINTTVISGSIMAAPEPELPRTLWSGDLPLNVTLPVFWDSENSGNVPPFGDLTVHAHAVIWSGQQMGPRIEGTFSLPQYSKSGVKWWTGRFNFLFKTSWGMLGDLDGIVNSNVNYYSKLVFRDIHGPTPLMAPTQFDVDTATSMPIILLGTYSSDRKMFYWTGNVVIGIRYNPWNFLNKSPSLPLEGAAKKPKPTYTPSWPMTKPKTRVGVLVTQGRVTNLTGGGNSSLPLWSGGVPVKISLADFNVSKGVNIMWTAKSLYPKFEGTFSLPQYKKNADDFKIVWMDGEFSFDLTTVWNTSLDMIEVGKQYATVISSNATKLTKSNKNDSISSILSLIMANAELAGSQIGVVNLKGSFTPDMMFFNWLGEAWFYLEKNKTVGPGPKQQLAAPEDSMNLMKGLPFGGAVNDGWVTSGSSSFFSFSSTIWSGALPAEIPLTSLWSSSIFGGSKLARGIYWTPTEVTEELLMGSYNVPQISWDGLSTSVTWIKGEFKLFIRPLWLSSWTNFVKPGVQYYSKVSFQGGPPMLMETAQVAGASGLLGIKAPIILQGTYSPDRMSFFWSGNFIMNFKMPKDPFAPSV